jgi:hypothetical protein
MSFVSGAVTDAFAVGAGDDERVMADAASVADPVVIEADDEMVVARSVLAIEGDVDLDGCGLPDEDAAEVSVVEASCV